MIFFRNHPFTRIFSLFTGLVFLNMGFFLAEISMLELKDRRMVENVRNLVLTGGLEEERDSHGSANDAPIKAFTMDSAHLRLRHSSLFLIAARLHGDCEDHYLHADYSEIVSPPPESVAPFS